MKFPPHISRTAGAQAIASVAAFISGVAALLASIFWMGSVPLPLGIAGIVGGWLLFELSMQRTAKDNGTDVGR
ncbi:hypothetical protein CHU95_02350 [Niveispirillum lacus]|uniref:Uncharacterized protein n=1 Tax=Niveispirillum lacus TaxID=1981099 RepID=A0A255Z6H4_9PROT|nr:hypothetical protein [Niveispirillum lacus]OYQ37039.1 hypothetical protein CHU95_02350 [Niveispirillum lacus]